MFFCNFFQILEHTVGRRRRSSADVDLLTGHSTITPIISSMSNVTLLCVDVYSIKRPIASLVCAEQRERASVYFFNLSIFGAKVQKKGR